MLNRRNRVRRPRTVELGVVEWRRDNIVHRSASRRTRDQAAHEQARKRCVPVREVIDVRLVHLRRRLFVADQSEPGEARIARVEGVERRDGVDAHGEEVERAALQRVCRSLVESPVARQPIAIARLLEEPLFFFAAQARQQVAVRCIELNELRAQFRRQRKVGNEGLGRSGVHPIRTNVVRNHAHRIAGHQPVFAEGLTREEHAAGKAQRWVERPVERGFEARDVHAERAEQRLGLVAPQALGRLQRLAPAVADQGPATDPELVARGVPTEVRVIIQDQNACARPSLPPVPRGRKPAQAGADNHDIVRLGQRNMRQVETGTVAQRVGHVERPCVTSPQTRFAGRVGLGGRSPRKQLRRGRAGDDRQCDAIEKIAAGHPGHGENLTASDGAMDSRFTLAVSLDRM